MSGLLAAVLLAGLAGGAGASQFARRAGSRPPDPATTSTAAPRVLTTKYAGSRATSATVVTPASRVLSTRYNELRPTSPILIAPRVRTTRYVETQLTSPLVISATPRASATSVVLSAAAPVPAGEDRGTSWAADDVKELPVAQWRELELTSPPAPRMRPLMVYETDRQRTLLFGGFLANQENCSETWEFDGREWKRLDVAAPPTDSGYMMAYDVYRGAVVLYGGRDRDTWLFDGMRWKRLKCQTRPPVNGFGAMAYDPNARHVVLFGGEARPAPGSVLPVSSDETWQFDGNDWAKMDVSGPSPRKYHGMVYDAARKRFVLFGGFTDRLCNETWELADAGWQSVPTAAAPSPRRGFAMTYDPIGRRTLLAGGSRGGDELWAYDGANWKPIMALRAPPYREGAGFVFIPTSGRALLFGGLSLQMRNDTWEFIRERPDRSVVLPPAPPLSPLAALADLVSARPRGPTEPTTGPQVIPPAPIVPEEQVPLPARTTATVEAPPALPPPPPPANVTDLGESPSRPDLAELHFDAVRILQFTLVPNQAVAVTGNLLNTGSKDATCWIEFWLSPTRQPFEHRHLACQSQNVRVKAGGSIDLWNLRLTLSAKIPPGEYYFGVEVDRGNEVPEQDESNNLWIINTPYKVAPPR